MKHPVLAYQIWEIYPLPTRLFEPKHLFKKITENKIGFKITSLSESKRLSEIILISHDLNLNYNTIRRFFGVVKSVKASNYTLDTLAIFNGYKSYNDFLINFG